MMGDMFSFVEQFYGVSVLVLYPLAFMMGASIESAVNCLFWKVAHGQDWVRGRSVCEHCGRTLDWWEIIPVFSCLALRGRCRTCGKYFGIKHGLLEALLGIVFVLSVTELPILGCRTTLLVLFVNILWFCVIAHLNAR